MKELEIILREHAARYPAMEPTDAVKLIYQNEFGGGHLITDEEAFMNRLRREYQFTEKKPDGPRCESIGNGLVRVHLAALQEQELEQLGQRFIQSASIHKGDLKRFQKKLELLRPLTEEGVFRFGPEALEQYLAEYRNAGYPAVSHSTAYRTTYRPAYRIVLL